MNWWDAFKLIMKIIPCITGLLGDLKKAKADDGKVSFEELNEIISNFMGCLESKFEAAVRANLI
jgi:hypothetical protein